RAKVLAQKFGAKYYLSLEKMLSQPNIDATVICTPHAFHAEQCVLAAEAGKHVLVEKPMATSLEDCDRMIEACRRSNVKLMVAHSHRFWPGNVKAKQLIEKGEVGRLLTAYDSVVGGGFGPVGSRDPKDRFSWMQSRKLGGGGAVMFNGSHIIDRLRWWIGSEVKKVLAKVGNEVYGSEVEEYGSAFLLFENGVSATMTVSMATPGAGYCIAELIGTDGLIEVKTYENVRLGKKNWETVHVFNPENERNLTFMAEAKEFVTSILEDRRPLITGEEGKANVEVVLAIYKSS
ncbi:Gfo/Idh/MocA family oxidoreductase, partial [Candidatus Bathyarchaeota archaeon]|nr:Gfo/Idh/MocA family oxidoreductase [Candidatus Bathyarchaeota archaeon]